MKVMDLIWEWNPSFPIFSSQQYLSNLQASRYGWIGGYENGELVAIIPYIIKKKLIFKYLQFQHHIIATSCNEIDEKIFLNQTIDYIKKNKIADFVIQPLNHVVFNDIPNHVQWCRFGSYFIDLTEEEDTIWSKMNQKHRNVIRKAISIDVEVCRGNQFAEVAYQLIKETMNRSDMPFMDIHSFNSWLSSFGEYVEVFVAFHDNKPQGCAVLPYSLSCSYYVHGGSIENPVTGAINYMHFEAMKYFRNKGVRGYDFVGARIQPEAGSKVESIQRFKSRFGATMREGYLWKCNLQGKLKYALYRLLISLRNKKGDIIDQECRKKKHSTDV